MTADARFWDKIAPRYAARPVSNPEAYARKLALTRAHLRPDMTVLELGCGTGSTALAHAPHVARIVATDISEAMLAIARTRAREAGIDTVEFRQATPETAGADGTRYDVVLALSLLHLLPDLDSALARIRDLLPPGGLLVSNTACLAEGMAWFGAIAPLGRALGLIPYVNILSARALLAALDRAGFEIVEDFRPDRRTLFLIARRRG